MKCGAVFGDDPFVRVTGLIAEWISQHFSMLETAVSRSTPGSANEGHPDSNVVIDACLMPNVRSYVKPM